MCVRPPCARALMGRGLAIDPTDTLAQGNGLGGANLSAFESELRFSAAVVVSRVRCSEVSFGSLSERNSERDLSMRTSMSTSRIGRGLSESFERYERD